MFEPANLKRWTMPDSYFGATWPDYYSASVGQSRDSDALERSNFACMLRDLGGESDTVLVIRESHWAVGWVEWIAIHETDEKALCIADTNAARMASYPILDEGHYSELEQTDANETWAQCYRPSDRLDYVRRNRYQFDFAGYADLIGCIRGRYFAGYASELLG